MAQSVAGKAVVAMSRQWNSKLGALKVSLLRTMRAGTISIAIYFLVCFTNSFPTLKSPQPKSATVSGSVKESKNVITAF